MERTIHTDSTPVNLNSFPYNVDMRRLVLATYTRKVQATWLLSRGAFTSIYRAMYLHNHRCLMSSFKSTAFLKRGRQKPGVDNLQGELHKVGF